MTWITVEMVTFAGLMSLFLAFYLVLRTVIAAVGWPGDEPNSDNPGVG